MSEQNIQSAPPEFGASIVRNFEKYRSGLLSTVNVALKNRHYQNMNLQVPLNFNYDTFSQFPILTSDQIVDPKNFYTGNKSDLHHENSGGTTGSEKTFYYTDDFLKINIDPNVLEVIKNAQKSCLLYRHADTTSYHITEMNLKRLVPGIQIKKYTSVKEVLEMIEENDVIYLTEHTSKMRDLMHEFSRLAKEDRGMMQKKLNGKQFFLETEAEPIHLDEIKNWFDLITDLTGKNPSIWDIYGTAETLKLGFWEFDKENPTRKIEYIIPDNKFVEVLDPDTGKPVESGKVGIIVATPLYADDYPGMVFMRFKTGDLAQVRYDDKGRMFISEIHRDPQSGIISVGNGRISVPQVWESLQQELAFPIHIKFGCKTIHQTEGKTILDINIYSESINPQNTEVVKSTLTKILMQLCPEYDELIRNSTLQTNINTHNQIPIEQVKAWKIEQK